MEIVKQPDIRVFASEAKTGEILVFPDVLRGWGVTLDQTQGKPPIEWMNDAFNRIDLNNLYLLQQGIPEWNKSTRYPLNAIIKHAGKIYLCTAENDNNEPSANSEKWSLYVKNATEKEVGILKIATQAEVDAGTNDTNAITPKNLAEKLKKLPDATITKKGITQLTNIIDGSEDRAATPKALNELKKEIMGSLVPVGATFAWDFEDPPENYLLRRGQSFSATEYPELAKLFPSLKLPDDRGVVHRGLDAGRGFDPSRKLGGYQADAIVNIVGHVSNVQFVGDMVASGPFRVIQNRNWAGLYSLGAPGPSLNSTGSIEFRASDQFNTANESRMKNNAVNFIIKAR